MALKVLTVVEDEVREWREWPGGDCSWVALNLDELAELEAALVAARARAVFGAMAEAQDPLPLLTRVA